eukprot:GHRR01010761.1.p1 GENE.GHRR01010761.1~~GHRR01010761.1.p1  ORF type:complete len:250 (+),score=57.57 GHRR01010761.1:1283-2032(+)
MWGTICWYCQNLLSGIKRQPIMNSLCVDINTTVLQCQWTTGQSISACAWLNRQGSACAACHRRLFGLQPVKSFQELSPDDPQVAEILQNLYGNISNVDAYVGGLAEPHYLQGHVGELFYKSIYDQFFRLREGDWWYYENFENNRLFTAQEVEEIQATTLRDLILRNTDIKDLPGDIWTAISPGTCPTRLAADGGSNSNSSGSQDLLVNGLLAVSLISQMKGLPSVRQLLISCLCGSRQRCHWQQQQLLL